MKNTILTLVLGLSLAISLGVNTELAAAQLSGCVNYTIEPTETVINSTWLLEVGFSTQNNNTFMDCDGVEIDRVVYSGLWGDDNLTLAFMPTETYTQCYLNVNCSEGAPLNEPRNVYAMYSDFDDGSLDGWEYNPMDGSVIADNIQYNSENYSMLIDHNETGIETVIKTAKNANPNYVSFWGNFSTDTNSDSYLFGYGCADLSYENISHCNEMFSISILKYGLYVDYLDHTGNFGNCYNLDWTDDIYHFVELKNINKTLGNYGYYEIWSDGFFRCEAEFKTTGQDIMRYFQFHPDSNRVRKFWVDDFKSAYLVNAEIYTPPVAPPEIPDNAETFCASDSVLYSRGYDVAQNGSTVINVRYFSCPYGCENSTITGLGAAGCAESPLQLALLFMVAVVGVIAALAWLNKR